MPQGAVYGVFLENDGTEYHRGVKVIKANCSCVEMECDRKKYIACVSKCSLYVFTIIPPCLMDQCNFMTVL